MFRKTLPIFLLLTFLFTTGQGCGGPSVAEQAAAQPVTLTIWRVFDEDDTMKDIMNAYRTLHPNVSFEYRQMRVDEYKNELLRAFAEGTGPDIFSIHNTWMNEFKSLIGPLPASLTIPYIEIKGTIKQEKIITLREEPSITPAQVRRDFVDVVAQDAVMRYQPNPKDVPQERIFGLPMSVDTLAMFYNKDLLNAAGIAQPPTNWAEFQAAVVALTSIGTDDLIIQSGAALGGSANVERAFDIVSLLMMQNGTPMIDDRGNCTIGWNDRDKQTVPGADAVRFYTDFANPLKEVYAWNASQPNSFDAFTSGKTAFFFGYSYHLPQVRSRAPKLNFAVAPTPQISGGHTVNYANYWVETVSKATKANNWAWDFVQFATKANQVQSYLKIANRPTARRDLINSQIDDEDLNPFVSQLLTAQSWYRGQDIEVAEQAFLDLIDAALAGKIIEDEIDLTQSKINQTL
ncbi:extracellular solute-binding protein [Patescibacteria group bacterium]|nr:extracellular solute-binding protein [Patescibacteria group bacterium]MBU1705509.1 extracellular solute-binding protein [Patescibacteria group bacterium]